MSVVRIMYGVGETHSIHYPLEMERDCVQFNSKITAYMGLSMKIGNMAVDTVKNEILSKLNIRVKRELISQVISKINKSNFKKSDFNEFSRKKNIYFRNNVLIIQYQYVFSGITC